MSHRFSSVRAWICCAALPWITPPGPAAAHTWRVERDGTGDFSTIKPALAAAVQGDTIQLGPGRYTEVEPFSLPGWTEPTYVGVYTENLTLRGTNRDAVIIGPTAPDFTTYGPKGIVTQVNVQHLRLENLTVENVHDGLYLIGNVVLHGCLLRRCDLGVIGVDGLSLRAEGCEAQRCREAIDVWNGHDLEVLDSVFTENSVGVSYMQCQRGNVRRCHFENGIGGTKHDDSDGLVEYCSFMNLNNYAIVGTGTARVIANHNAAHGGQAQLWSSLYADISGTDNLLRGSTYATVLVESYATASVHSSNILPAQGYGARADGYVHPDRSTIDLTNNYWGVDSADAIRELIWDVNDDPQTNAVFLFEPFATHSVPARSISVGGLKSRFGGDPAPGKGGPVRK